MKLIIEINTTEKYNRRIANNLLANSNSEIHHFILNATASELDTTRNMGNRHYDLKIKLEETNE